MLLKTILQPFYTVYVVVTFLAGLLVTFPFFLLLSFGNNYGSRKAIWTIIRYWARIWLWAIGMPLRLCGPRPPASRYIVVANHISYLDTVVLFPALPGYFRALGKKEFSRVPILGFVYRQLAIMVTRTSAESRTKSMRIMWRVLKNEGDILIFPEGTFNETGKPLKDFYNGAFRLAITTQTPILPIIFPDTVHRWHYSAWWKVWPGTNRAVYLPPIAVAGMTMNDLASLKQQVTEVMQAALMKYNYP
jgi:1-acyl-sn-glycerol-3-phosphate acyltransferase